MRNLSAYCAALPRADQRVHASGHRRLSAREPARGRGDAGGGIRWAACRAAGRVTRSRSTLLLLLSAAIWAAAAWLALALDGAGATIYRTSTSTRSFRRTCCSARSTSAPSCDFFWLAQTLTQLVVLGLFTRYGVRWTRESAAGPIGTGMLLGMIGFALVWAAELPFAVLGRLVEPSLRALRQLRAGNARQLACARARSSSCSAWRSRS